MAELFHYRKILEFCEGQRDWLLETTTVLARLESPTSDKAAVDHCGTELARQFVALGAHVETLRSEATGNHLRATVGSGSSQLLLLGHFDTVWPVGQLERMPIRLEIGRLYGPGVFDMKAGIAIGLLAFRSLAELRWRPRKRIVMLMTADEEHGSGSSAEFVEEEARRSDAVLVLEPSLPGGALKTSRKGAGEFELTVHGISAHAGLEPEKGASAISELAAQVLAIEKLRNDARGVSINVGLIEGGSRPNVVPERARAVIDVRAVTQADARVVESALHALRPVRSGTTLRVCGGFSRPPFERTEAVAELYRLAQSIAAELGHELDEGSAGGGSDGNLTGALGIPTLDGMGAVGDGAHALHEHIEIDHLPWRAALVAGLIRRLDALPSRGEGM